MGVFLTELGKQLAERWFTLLVLPGALFLSALATAQHLGHTHAFAIARLADQVNQWARAYGVNTPARLVVILIAVLLISAAAGLVAQAGGTLTERLWLAADWAAWPPPLRQLAGKRVSARQDRWDQASDEYKRQREQLARDRAHGRRRDRGALAAAYRDRVRISQEKPERPTWMGDRLNVVAVRFDREYQLDIPTVWPALWLTLPDTDRSEIRTAREALARATTLTSWGLLYLVVGALWWPGLLLAAATCLTGWRRARTATDTYAQLVEAAVRLYVANLARQLGFEQAGPITPQVGANLTYLLQGNGHLIPTITAETSTPISTHTLRPESSSVAQVMHRKMAGIRRLLGEHHNDQL
ncbi:hypothetical protein [Streptomyces xanthophaeus]|uniref:hypothetical protein n=1 Tax=Streptomyces xanthophaeus TaxID=67385 RepID=UPI00264A3575|nr:hypothetical protein [Streptomyces xanthophaeus]WKD31229.1 hypothetical protein KO717_04145 [Streptomyces xanthophaeus]